MSSGWSDRAHEEERRLLLPSLFQLTPHLLPALPFAFALSECISALLLLLAQRLPSANISTLVITQLSCLHLRLHSLSTCPWLYTSSHPHRCKRGTCVLVWQVLKDGRSTRGGQNLQGIWPRGVRFVQDRTWKRACKSKVFCILFESAKTCHGPHTCLPTSCLARRTSRLWLPAQLQGRLSLRISFALWSGAVPFLKDPKPWAQPGLCQNAVRAGGICHAQPSAQPGPSALRGGPCFTHVNQQHAPKGSPSVHPKVYQKLCLSAGLSANGVIQGDFGLKHWCKLAPKISYRFTRCLWCEPKPKHDFFFLYDEYA